MTQEKSDERPGSLKGWGSSESRKPGDEACLKLWGVLSEGETVTSANDVAERQVHRPLALMTWRWPRQEHRCTFLPPSPIPPLWVITEHQAALPELYDRFPLASYVTPEKAMAPPHSSILAWRIPGTGEPGGLPSVGSRRVRHNRSDLAAAAAAVLHMAVHVHQSQSPSSSPPPPHVHMSIPYICISIPANREGIYAHG